MTKDAVASYETLEALEGLEPVRVRPGMYVGDSSTRGYHHCLWEVVDNSVDEAMGGYATSISVTIHDNGSVTIEDDGRGIPISPHKGGSYDGMPGVELAFSVLHAGGKFDGEGYAFSGGLHGVGISVVNALSRWVNVEVKRDGTRYGIEFAAVEVPGEMYHGKQKIRSGQVVTPLYEMGKAKKGETGTKVTFLLDDRVFSCEGFDPNIVLNRMRQYSFMNPGVHFLFNDERDPESEPVDFISQRGLPDYAMYLTEGRLGESQPIIQDPISLKGEDDGIPWEIALHWVPDNRFDIAGFTNGVENPSGGTHVDGLTSSLTAMLNKYARQDHIGLLSDKDNNLTGNDVQSGLCALVSVKVRNPEFQGQTKDRLGNTEARTVIRRAVNTELWHWAGEHPAEMAAILEKGISEMRIRQAARDAADKARNAEEKRGISARSLPLPVSLNDCRSKKRDDCELFIVEGKSAAGPAIGARNSDKQAVLPIRGKIINVLSNDSSRVSNNEEVKAIIAALGAGSEDEFDISKLRYGKVVILTDADADGFHIISLLMTLFLHLMPDMVHKGHLWVARPPLFSTVLSDKKVFVHSIEERDKFTEDHPRNNLTWTRFKGLGEMNVDELGETAINPDTRILQQVTISDAGTAEGVMWDLLGGDAGAKWNMLQQPVEDLAAIIGV